ncbi:putative bifunctional diguanylate cyclase/phosphodiesterase [Thalassospira alkalitolerans]|uniref:Diguanylate cyclase n=1 Tax=Thalassospira alkalitolerans TaxID=1293890 RepID=A0A1Y2LA97_9PROT|nr:bifunctional diguanylate cyclase/phosphodiesterase [Thalassospira alkalitolerans]OSQ47056.1 diguanylate cyclase [Thalassospira alkalitolerans]
MGQLTARMANIVKRLLFDPGHGHEAVPELQRKVRADLLDLAYRNNWSNILVNLAAGSCLAGALWLQGEFSYFTTIWISAIVAITVIRLWGGYRYRVKRRLSATLDDHEFRKWLLGYACGVCLAGSFWALLSLFDLPNFGIESRFLTLMILAGLSGGATGILAPIFRVGRFYLAVLLLPAILTLIAMPEPHYVLVILGFVFLIVMLETHRNNHLILYRSLALKHENDGLVDDLREKNRITENWNATLEARVAKRTRELRNLLVHDTLTGLLNRDGIVAWFKEAQGNHESQACAVLFIDLDHFKQINDGLSHAIGDLVLKEVATRLRQYVDDHHAVGRWGGDEFIMILTGRRDNLHQLVEQAITEAREAVNRPINIVGQTLHVGFSTGVAFGMDDNPQIAELIHRADLAAAEVKRSGRGSVYRYDSTLLVEQERRLAINQALRQAMSANELFLEYQPIIRAANGDISAYEVLLRWESADLGRVGPDEFIPIAEESALIVDIGEWVLREACKTVMGWSGFGGGPKVAVNVSVRQIVVPRFARMVENLLRETGFPAGRLIIEVTESIFEIRRTQLVSEVLADLHDLGVEIHIDDFGTGYSSLSRLHEIRVDAVKIDKSFVLNMDVNARAVIEGAILIAHRFGLVVIAEGVETSQQRDELAAMGVDAYQGYFFARPAEGVCQDLHWQDTPRSF